MRNLIDIECGCANCGTEEHEVSVEYVKIAWFEVDGGNKLDIVLKCTGCGHTLNGFMDLEEMVELRDDQR